MQRYYSAGIGEGLIFDMRTALFDHVQHQPLSFFTRTQTGSLMSRMNNDVIGAQQAVTNTLGTVFSNVVTVVVTLAFMLALEWRLTLLTLVILPLFIIPAKRMGPKLQRLTRESMQLNASMNNTIAERFNVGGALVVKLFGTPTASESETFSDRAGRVRDIGVQTAMYSRILFVGARARRRHRHRDRLLRRRQPRDLRHHRRRHHRRVHRVREPDLPTAHAARRTRGSTCSPRSSRSSGCSRCSTSRR